MAKQLSVFLENKPGRLKSVTAALNNGQINIRAFTLQDRGGFGLLKMVVNKPEQAHLLLLEKGFAAALKDVMVISIPDKPGNLDKLTRILLENCVNIVDANGFVLESDKLGLCCVELEGKITDGLKDTLCGQGFSVLTDEEIYEF